MNSQVTYWPLKTLPRILSKKDCQVSWLTVKQKVGEGSYGVSYLACTVKNPECKYIVKKVQFQRVNDLESFTIESELALRAGNRGYGVKVSNFFVCEDKQVGVIIMEKAEALEDFTQEDIVPFSTRVDDMHKDGVLHQDLYYRNVMRDQQGRPIIIDFGMAIPLNQELPEQLKAVEFAGFLLGHPAQDQPVPVAGVRDISDYSTFSKFKERLISRFGLEIFTKAKHMKVRNTDGFIDAEDYYTLVFDNVQVDFIAAVLQSRVGNEILEGWMVWDMFADSKYKPNQFNRKLRKKIQQKLTEPRAAVEAPAEPGGLGMYYRNFMDYWWSKPSIPKTPKRRSITPKRKSITPKPRMQKVVNQKTPAKVAPVRITTPAVSSNYVTFSEDLLSSELKQTLEYLGIPDGISLNGTTKSRMNKTLLLRTLRNIYRGRNGQTNPTYATICKALKNSENLTIPQTQLLSECV
jgi:serine/threonine protein kinase